MKISDLPDGGAIQVNDVVPVVRGNANRKVTDFASASALAAGTLPVGAAVVVTAADAVEPAGVSRSLQKRASDAVHVRDMGAVGDGSTDDSAAFQAAIDAASARYAATGQITRLLGSPKDIYKVVGNSNGALRQKSGVVFDGQGCRIVGAPSGTNGILIGGNKTVTLGTPVSLAANAAAGSKSFQVNSGTWTVGTYCALSSLALCDSASGTNTRFQVFRIRAVSGSSPITITVDDYITEDFNTADSAQATPDIPMLADFGWKNVVLDMISLNAETVYRAAYWRFCERTLFENIKVLGGGDVSEAALTLSDARSCTVRDYSVADLAPGDEVTPGTPNGYGIVISGASRRVVIERAIGRRVRHTITTLFGASGGQPEYITYRDCEAYDNHLSGIDTHPDGRYIDIVNCRAVGNGDCGVQVRAKHVTVRDGLAKNNANYGYRSNATTAPLFAKYINTRSENNGSTGGSAGLSIICGDVVEGGYHSHVRRAMMINDTTATALTRVNTVHLYASIAPAACLEILTNAGIVTDGMTLERAGSSMSGIITPRAGHLFRNTNFVNFPTFDAVRYTGAARNAFVSINETMDSAVQYYGFKYSMQFVDDSSKNWTPPKRRGYCRLFVEATGLTQYSIEFSYDLQANSAASISSGANAAVVASTALTGTSGTDGNVSVSISGGKIYTENRSGATREISLVFE